MKNDAVLHLGPDELYMEEVRRARGMPIVRKAFVGIELFDLACTFAKAGIRAQHPDADEKRVLEILRGRLALGRRLENGE